MTRQQTAKRLRETAYHEAGHAVAAFRLSVPFRYVDVIPEADRLGVLMHYQWVRSEAFRLALADVGELTLRQQDCVERHIIVTLAGGAAVRRLVPKSNVGDESDIHDAVNFAARIVGEAEVLKPYVAYMFARAEAFVHSPLNWMLIERLAEKLIEEHRIDGRTARAFLRQTIIDAVPPVSVRVTSTDADGSVHYAIAKKTPKKKK
jgi:hypothetical protein